MGGTTHVTPAEETKGDEVDSDIKTDANPEGTKEEAKVIPITTAVSEPVIDELTKPEAVADAAPTEDEGKE